MLSKLKITACLVFFGITTASAGVIVVHPSFSVSNIGQALRLANDGDTLLIKKAWYRVTDLVINKPVTLMGENYPVLDGEGKDEVLMVRANNVTIKGLHICNTNKGSLKNYAGILCDGVDNITIEHNLLENTLFPIYLPNTHHGVIRSNIIRGKSTSIESGSGIYLWHAGGLLIENNTVSGQRDGIYFEFSNRCRVLGNICKNNYRYGLHFMFSDHNIYENNIFINNDAGVAVMYSKYIIMQGNRFEQNWGAAAYGLLLKEINESFISKNIFEKNTTGIYMESSEKNKFTGNIFKENGRALNLLSDCTEDSFYHNYFSGNTFDISTNGRPEQNVFDYNYWDKYTGYDLNKDGIGDIPYYPVSLYSKITEDIPYAIVLLHSFVMNLMDEAERTVPSLIPISVIDNHPLIHYRP